MIWGAISLQARTDLVFVVGNVRGGNRRGLTAARYIDEILADHVVPYAEFVGENFVFMQDNAKPHGSQSDRTFVGRTQTKSSS